MVNYNDLHLPELETREEKVEIPGSATLQVRSYLPLAEKAALLDYVVERAIDENTGRFSPIRVELFYALAIAHWYGGLVFDDDIKALEAYDRLECYEVFDRIIAAIPEDEYKFMTEALNNTIKDIADYNSSFAGVVQMASSEAGGLGNQIDDILNKVENRKGMEALSEIKNVVGTD